MSSELAEMAWPEVPSGKFLVVPLGSCEQHGPHLPLDTDTRIAVACAEGLARADSGVVVGPAVGIGASGEHEGFPGTLSIGTLALETVLVELVRAALPAPGQDRPVPFRGVVLANGHGGNMEAVARAATLLDAEGRRVLVWHAQVPDGDSHAGRTETSILLHLAPTSVRLDRVEVGSTARWRDISDVVRTQGLAAVSPNGVLGDPTTATSEEGRAVFEALVADLCNAVNRWRATLDT